MAEIIDICPVSELPPGAKKLVEWEDLEIGVFNCGGTIHAIEDRCSHDNGALARASSTRRPAPSSVRATAHCSTCARASPRLCPHTFRWTPSR